MGGFTLYCGVINNITIIVYLCLLICIMLKFTSYKKLRIVDFLSITEKSVPNGSLPDDAMCTPDSRWKDECNWCFCGETGIAGCTLMGCPDSKLFLQISLLLLVLQIYLKEGILGYGCTMPPICI